MRSFLILAIIILIQPLAVIAGQSSATTQNPAIKSGDPTKETESQDSNPFTEARARAAIAREEGEFTKFKEAAAKLKEIAEDLSKSFQNGSGSPDKTQKAVSQIEKLAKNIRSRAGGSSTDIEEPLPTDLNSAVDELASLASKINQSVEKSSRFVISAAVIDNSNKVLALTKVIKQLLQK